MRVLGTQDESDTICGRAPGAAGVFQKRGSPGRAKSVRCSWGGGRRQGSRKGQEPPGLPSYTPGTLVKVTHQLQLVPNRQADAGKVGTVTPPLSLFARRSCGAEHGPSGLPVGGAGKVSLNPVLSLCGERVWGDVGFETSGQAWAHSQTKLPQWRLELLCVTSRAVLPSCPLAPLLPCTRRVVPPHSALGALRAAGPGDPVQEGKHPFLEHPGNLAFGGSALTLVGEPG